MIALSEKCFQFCFWTLVVALISTKDSSQAETNQPDGSVSTEATSQFFYHRSEYPRDCAEVVGRCPSSNSSGVYAIKPDGYPGVFDVFCHSDGYTVISRRLDGTISFDRTWGDYASGFGFLSNEFWLGNQKLSFLTNQKRYRLQIDVELNDGSRLLATYDDFRISDAHSDYILIDIGQFYIDGGFRYWGPWAPCSVTCGEGVKRRVTRCTNGATCIGENVEGTAHCNETECPVDGEWSSWSTWPECPVSCGGSRRVRERVCNDPAPQHGGRDCRGTARQNQVCGTDPCPVDGEWSSWSGWTQCSVTCGGGQQIRQRECNDPAPLHGGRNCAGRSRQDRSCGTASCRTIRLVNGPNSHSGRVEVYVDGEWGTICDYLWYADSAYNGAKNADVACRQLGYAGGAASFHRDAYFGEGAGPSFYVYKCSGSESRLDDCPYFNRSACDHDDDVGVVCRRSG